MEKKALTQFVVSRTCRELDQVQGQPEHGRLAERVYPGDVRAVVVHPLEHLDEFVIVVVFELERQRRRREDSC